MKKYAVIYFLVTVAAICLNGCKSGKKDTSEVSADSAAVDPAGINNLFLDSMSVAAFLESHREFKNQSKQLEKFYQKRKYQFAWFNNDGLVEQSANFMNMLMNLHQEGISDSSIYNPELKLLYDTITTGAYQFNGADAVSKEIELLLSSEFFKYAQQIWGGIGENQLKDLDWYIKRKQLPYVTMLDSMIANPNFFAEQKPVYRQYDLLKDYLKNYRTIDSLTAWSPIVTDQKAYKKGDSSLVISEIRKRLFVFGDLTTPDTVSHVFDQELEPAVKAFQRRYGLKEDGVIGAAMIAELNVPVSNRIQQIMVNMERSRWVPIQLKGDYLAVNIPEYRLHVYEHDSLVWDCNVVVGSVTNQTVIFNGDMKYIAFSPYWNIPSSIIGKEILPAMKRNSSYLAKHNMEVVSGSGVVNPSSIDWNKYTGKNFPYTIRQKPGPNNSLGRVKFLFPNSYSIYLHDTPAKSLFNESSRAFSHGCIRVGEPQRLAEYLLRNDSVWTADKIEKAMNSDKETSVTLSTPVPVFIAYFTAWVDRSGKINFRDDIYGHDARLARVMFNNPAL